MCFCAFDGLGSLLKRVLWCCLFCTGCREGVACLVGVCSGLSLVLVYLLPFRVLYFWFCMVWGEATVCSGSLSERSFLTCEGG